MLVELAALLLHHAQMICLPWSWLAALALLISSGASTHVALYVLWCASGGVPHVYNTLHVDTASVEA